MRQFRDQRMEQEFPAWGEIHRKAAKSVLEDLTTYLGLPTETIAQEYWRYRTGEDTLAQERVARATDEATVAAYYAMTPHYLYELSYWEASFDKQAWFRVLLCAAQKYNWRHVLDFGGGVGGLSLYLQSHGIDCDHLDIPGKTFDYAKWRFARHKLNVAVLDATSRNGLPQGFYDAVIAWDVLEHLFDLEGAIDTIARLLRPNGWFISKSTFAESDGHHLHIHLAKHARYADVKALNALVGRYGFQYLGQLKPNRLSRLLRGCGFRHAVAGMRIAPRLKHGGNFLVHAVTQ